MPQDDVIKVLKKNVTKHMTVTELADELRQSNASVRTLIRKLWKDNELRRRCVKRGHQNVFAYTLK